MLFNIVVINFKTMKGVQIKKFNKVEAPKGQYENITAFQLVEFTINIYGYERTFVLDTIFTKDGKQLVKDGNGFIPTGYEITA